MSAEWKALVARSRPAKAKGANLTVIGAGQPIGICVGPINLAGKLARSVEPAVGLIVQYVCDEAFS
jgi:hypothetical protein